MASKVKICNLALTRLGADRITSLTDNSISSKLCNLFYDEVVEDVLIEGQWTSALRRADLAQTSNTPTYEFDHEYQLPTDPALLKIVSINEDSPGLNDYKIEDDKLLTDMDSVSIRYIAKIEDPQSYDPMLKKAIVTRLTAELAYPITGQQSVAQRWFQKYEQDLARALAINGQQGNKECTVSDTLINVR